MNSLNSSGTRNGTKDKLAVGEVWTKPIVRRRPAARPSRGGLDEINAEDIVYGEYSSGNKNHGSWIDLVYLDDDILRTYSDAVSPHHPVLEDLKVLLRNEDAFYVVPIKEVPLGFAFKRMDILKIKASLVVEGNDDHEPSCIWKMHFKDGNIRTLETDYQAYFAYGNTIRPRSMTNATILEKVFAESKK